MVTQQERKWEANENANARERAKHSSSAKQETRMQEDEVLVNYEGGVLERDGASGTGDLPPPSRQPRPLHVMRSKR
jgi:hypothetical protein